MGVAMNFSVLTGCCLLLVLPALKGKPSPKWFLVKTKSSRGRHSPHSYRGGDYKSTVIKDVEGDFGNYGNYQHKSSDSGLEFPAKRVEEAPKKLDQGASSGKDYELVAPGNSTSLLGDYAGTDSYGFTADSNKDYDNT